MATPSVPLKQCSRKDECVNPLGSWLPATTEYFYKSGRYLQGRCKACGVVTLREWRANNPEKAQRIEQRSYANKKTRNPRKLKADGAVRSQNHYQRNKTKKRDQSREGMRRWRAANRELHRLREHERRSRIKGLPYRFTQADVEFALQYFDYRCAYCGRQADFWTVLALDHYIPLHSPDCQGTIPTNIVPACHSRKGSPDGLAGCNQSKGDTLPREWLVKRFGEREAKRIIDAIDVYFQKVGKCAF